MPECDGRWVARLGHDFSQVRVHADQTAVRSAGTQAPLLHQAPAVAQGIEGQQDELFTQAAVGGAIGAVLGGAIGAVAGALLGGPVGAVVGGLLGAAAGGAIGALLGGAGAGGAGGGPATFSAGPVHQVNNLADCAVNNKPAGRTPPTLNGAVLFSTQAGRAALARPTLKTSAASGGFDAQVDGVPANTGSFDETVLAPGPWTINTSKAAVAAAFPMLNGCTGPGNTTFQAFGDPSDAAMFAANRRHEDHHANDHKNIFNATIVPWADQLAAAKAKKQTFHGADAAQAEAALWGAVSGTPDQVADAFVTKCFAAGAAFHQTPAGGTVRLSAPPTADAQCQNVSAKFKNPS
jgi:hypothetical protein